MLTKIRASGERKAPESAVEHLLACHERIRRMTALAARLPDAGSVPPAELAEAAGQVLKYFTVALPHHARDEDESVAPRLLALPGVPLEVARAAETMMGEHLPIEAAIADGVPLWGAVAAEPARLAELRTPLAAVGRRLGELFAVHLPPEEQILFPALERLLAPEALAELRLEMRRRRGENV